PVGSGGEPGALAVLDQVDPGLVGAPGKTPGDVVVLGDARAGLVGGAQDRIADVGGGVDDRADLADLVLIQPFGVDPVELVGLDAPHAVADVLQGVRQVEHPALAEQDRVAEVLLQALPEPEGMLVDGRGRVPQVVRPDDRGVAGHVAAGQPAALQDRDVGDAVAFGQVVRGGQAVPAAADDHYVVAGLRVGVAPQEIRVLRQVRAGGPGAHRPASVRPG